MANLQVNYLDASGTIIASYVAADEFSPRTVSMWTNWLNDRTISHPGEPEEWDRFDIVKQSMNWKWTCGNRSRAGLTEAQASLLVKVHGGEMIEMPELEPIIQVSKPDILPATEQTFESARSTYGRGGRYNGD